ncbi:MAG TPA: dipeptide epimerase [Lentisphaeria bacterium]|nr:MAG: dipeptide epimerase [Lentisphaerae bacterium GWF2_38_69]HBM17584.1 dipeptide epimerase [Lentisphaeria bacterium]
MIIASISIGRTKIPLKRPFITALRRADFVEDIVVQVKTVCGKTGYGSAAPTPAITGDTQDSIISAIKNYIFPRIKDKPIFEFENLLNIVQTSCINNTSAKACIDMALHDLIAQYCNIPLYQFLGGNQRFIDTVNTVSVKDPVDMAKDALVFIQEGFKILKIKVGLNPHDDIERLKAIREAVGYSIPVLTDANQGWTAKDALMVINAIETEKLNVALIEQPVKAWDLDSMKYIRENTNSFIMADESCFSPRDAFKIISEKIADGLNIKLMKCGGIYNAKSIYSMASTFNIPCMAGCMLESPIGLTAMASFVSGRSLIKYADLDPIYMIKENPIAGGARLKDARIELPEKPGLGIESLGNCIDFICES